MSNINPINDKYFKNYDAMDCPWVESPFFYEILKNLDLTKEDRELATHFHEEGYVKIDLNLSDKFISEMIDEITKKISDDNLKTQEGGYHYSEHPRLFESWKWSQKVLDIVKHKKILKTLDLLYRREPIPFQTINFVGGSSQPLHSDSIHFSSIPERWVAAVWTALENTDEENGTLIYVPKSHKLPLYEFSNINLDTPEYGKQFEAYAEYEEFLRQLVKVKGLEIKKFCAKPGEALIWSSNLLHGGLEIKDTKRTRYSQATHYYFKGCKHYYSPMFSDKRIGKISEKNLNEKDIMNYEIKK